MKKFIFVLLAVVVIAGLAGCEKRASENRGLKVSADVIIMYK